MFRVDTETNAITLPQGDTISFRVRVTGPVSSSSVASLDRPQIISEVDCGPAVDPTDAQVAYISMMTGVDL